MNALRSSYRSQCRTQWNCICLHETVENRDVGAMLVASLDQVLLAIRNNEQEHETCKWVQNRLKRESHQSTKFITAHELGRTAVNFTCGRLRRSPPHRYRALRVQKPFHYDDRTHTLKWDFASFALMSLWRSGGAVATEAVYDGNSAVRYWHAADWPRSGAHVRKPAHRLPCPGCLPSENRQTG